MTEPKSCLFGYHLRAPNESDATGVEFRFTHELDHNAPLIRSSRIVAPHADKTLDLSLAMTWGCFDLAANLEIRCGRLLHSR